jgi:hypothetical protein
MRTSIAAIALLAYAVPARADTPVTGFMVYGGGVLVGRATNDRGEPLPGIEIHVANRTGAKIVVAAKDGTYRVDLGADPREPWVVFADGARLTGATSVSTATIDGEAIEVRETEPPATRPKPRSDLLSILPYTDAAIDKNVWTRSWLLLEVDAAGTVDHVKFLKRAGYGLDATALQAAFKLGFEPARDRADRPVRSLVLWTYEWPSYYWLKKIRGAGLAPGEEMAEVPCAPPNKPHAERRDCSSPDLGRALVESWIAPRSK